MQDSTVISEPGMGLPFGLLAYVGAGISVFFCYTNVLVGLVAPLVGAASFEINPHLQAVLMWGFAAVSVFGLARDRKLHGDSMPLLIGAVGLAVIIGTLYLAYDVLILILGYLLLVTATLLNPARQLVQLNRSVQQQASQLVSLNATLEERVQSQIGEIDRLARLKRFLSSEVANLITAEGKESLLNSHRRAIACLFFDVRNFTAFSEAVEPEEVMDVLQSVHQRLGKLVGVHGGTIGYRAGDGLMVIFNDPLPCEAPVREAIRLALEMKSGVEEVESHWRKLGHNLGFGIGIAYGYATLGLIGEEGRYDYTAVGKVVNIAARLCDRAADGEILIDQRACVEIEDAAEIEAVGSLDLKGVGKPVEAYRVTGLKPAG